jgi:flagellin-specific chaperone FliS
MKRIMSRTAALLVSIVAVTSCSQGGSQGVPLSRTDRIFTMTDSRPSLVVDCLKKSGFSADINQYLEATKPQFTSNMSLLDAEKAVLQIRFNPAKVISADVQRSLLTPVLFKGQKYPGGCQEYASKASKHELIAQLDSAYRLTIEKLHGTTAFHEINKQFGRCMAKQTFPEVHEPADIFRYITNRAASTLESEKPSDLEQSLLAIEALRPVEKELLEANSKCNAAYLPKAAKLMKISTDSFEKLHSKEFDQIEARDQSPALDHH